MRLDVRGRLSGPWESEDFRRLALLYRYREEEKKTCKTWVNYGLRVPYNIIFYVMFGGFFMIDTNNLCRLPNLWYKKIIVHIFICK